MPPEPVHNNHIPMVTPFSKYLAMALLIILPFVALYIGYTFAPEKVVEIEVIKEIEKQMNTPQVSHNDGFIRQDLYKEIPGSGKVFVIKGDTVSVFTTYYGGAGFEIKTISDMEPRQLQLLGDSQWGSYISDGTDVFHIQTVEGGAFEFGVRKLDNMNLAKFKLISYQNSNDKEIVFARDGEDVYYEATKLEGLNPTMMNFNKYSMALYDADTVWKPDYGCLISNYEQGEREDDDPSSTDTGC